MLSNFTEKKLRRPAPQSLVVCEETVRRLVRRKVLHKLPGLRRVLINRVEIQRYLKAGENPVQS
jgi:hypothetical protein